MKLVATTTIQHGMVVDGKVKRFRFQPGAVVPKATVGDSLEALLESGALKEVAEPAPKKPAAKE
jgi:hypothetical protein